MVWNHSLAVRKFGATQNGVNVNEEIEVSFNLDF